MTLSPAPLLRIRTARRFHERFLGLMGKRSWPGDYDALWFPYCVSVHTCFTFLKPDLLFLDRNYRILSRAIQAKPFRLWFGPPGTRGCLELPTGTSQRQAWKAGVSLKKYFSPDSGFDFPGD
jgi:uncharacterized membrane protein (UPF0127 family)